MTAQGHRLNRHQRRAFDKQRRMGMKVSFSREVSYIPTWNGNDKLPKEEQITVLLKPLHTGDLITLMDTMQSSTGGKVDQESLTALGENNVNQLAELIDACGNLIPKHCTINNLEDETGPVTAENIVQFPYYMELSAELLAQLGDISMPNEVEEGNSEPQPVTAPTTTQ